jgi:osmoprotectant transport system ATP-binding protein
MVLVNYVARRELDHGMTQNRAIELTDVSKRFDNGVLALDGIGLTVRQGEFLAVLGESGSGKTTMLRMINRLLDPTAGTISVGDEDVQALDPILLRRRIGYVMQDAGLFPNMTVAENIAITPRLLGWEKTRMEARVSRMLDLVRLDQSFAGRLPQQLSGGQRQRVGLARALAAHPGIVLMDEPFAALDPLTRDTLAQEYKELHLALSLTTVMITHDVLEALSVADRIIVLRAGRVIAEGTPIDLVANGNTYVQQMMQAPRRLAERAGVIVNRKAQ